MATDYDTPRTNTVDDAAESLEVLKSRRETAQLAIVDAEDGSDGFDLPVPDLLDEELTVTVVPMRGDEFRCSRCFLVHHRSQLATHRAGEPVCRECA